MAPDTREATPVSLPCPCPVKPFPAPAASGRCTATPVSPSRRAQRSGDAGEPIGVSNPTFPSRGSNVHHRQPGAPACSCRCEPRRIGAAELVSATRRSIAAGACIPGGRVRSCTARAEPSHFQRKTEHEEPAVRPLIAGSDRRACRRSLRRSIEEHQRMEAGEGNNAPVRDGVEVSQRGRN